MEADTSTQNDLIIIQPPDFKEIFHERARLHLRSASYDMAIIVVVLFVCISIFVGADEIADFIFKSPIEKRADAALAEAEAKLRLAVADLAEPTAEAVRALPSALRPIVEKYLSPVLDETAPKVKTKEAISPGDEKASKSLPDDQSLSRFKESSGTEDHRPGSLSAPPAGGDRSFKNSGRRDEAPYSLEQAPRDESARLIGKPRQKAERFRNPIDADEI